MSRSYRSSFTAALMFVALPLAAQGVNQAPATTAVPSVAPTVSAPPVISDAPRSLAPTVENAAVGIRAPAVAPATVATNALPQDGRVGRNPAMMIVGGVALIAGSFIDGDAGTIVMIAGGALGLYGLWQYLK